MRPSFRQVEVIVVAAILVAVGSRLAPGRADADETADAVVKARLASLERRIDRFRAANAGAWPDFAGKGWGTLTDRRSLIGGGFLETAPANPAFPGADKTSIEVVDGAGVRGSPRAAWVWNVPESRLYASGFDETVGRVTGRAGD